MLCSLLTCEPHLSCLSGEDYRCLGRGSVRQTLHHSGQLDWSESYRGQNEWKSAWRDPPKGLQQGSLAARERKGERVTQILASDHCDTEARMSVYHCTSDSDSESGCVSEEAPAASLCTRSFNWLMKCVVSCGGCHWGLVMAKCIRDNSVFPSSAC